MIAWLAGRRVRLIGESAAIAAALQAHRAALAENDANILVHVAQPRAARPAHEIGYDDWRWTLDAGLDRRFLLARQWAEESLKAGRGGAALFVGAPEQSAGSDHAAAVGALGNLTKTLAVEWARDGLRINCILTRHDDETLGQLVAYLVSDYAAYVTGAVMGVRPDEGN